MNKSQRVLRSIVSMTTVFVVFSFVFVFVLGANAASTIGTNMSTTGTLTVTPATNSATSVQFQNAASTTYFFANSTNSRIGVGGAPQTVFEVQGTASASYLMTANSLQVAGVTVKVPVVLILVPIVLAAFAPRTKTKTKEKTTNTAVIETIDLKKR